MIKTQVFIKYINSVYTSEKKINVLLAELRFSIIIRNKNTIELFIRRALSILRVPFNALNKNEWENVI